jgi:hypothetical protein
MTYVYIISSLLMDIEKQKQIIFFIRVESRCIEVEQVELMLFELLTYILSAVS